MNELQTKISLLMEEKKELALQRKKLQRELMDIDTKIIGLNEEFRQLKYMLYLISLNINE